MSETKVSPDLSGIPSRNEAMGWRRTLAGVGVTLLFLALFVAAGAKGALGQLPLYVMILAVALLVVASIAGLVFRFSSRAESEKEVAEKKVA